MARKIKMSLSFYIGSLNIFIIFIKTLGVELHT